MKKNEGDKKRVSRGQLNIVLKRRVQKNIVRGQKKGSPFRFQISDFRFQISDFRFQISDFSFQNSDARGTGLLRPGEPGF